MEHRFVDIHSHGDNPLAVSPRMVGIHPWSAADYHISDADELSAILSDELSDAEILGETGLDALCGVDISRQEQLFRAHLMLAERLNLPIVIHAVRMFDHCLKIVGEYSIRSVVFHGFIGSAEQAARAVQKGYKLSFGMRSFSSPRTVSAMRSIPIESLFLESDEESEMIVDIYGRAADILSLSVDELKQRMWLNMKKFFKDE